MFGCRFKLAHFGKILQILFIIVLTVFSCLDFASCSMARARAEARFLGGVLEEGDDMVLLLGVRSSPSDVPFIIGAARRL